MDSILMESDSGKVCPYHFTKTDSKDLCWYLTVPLYGVEDEIDILGTLQERFNIDLSPLGKIDIEDRPLEIFMEDVGLEDEEIEEKGKWEAEWHRRIEISQNAWQPPQELIGCLHSLVDRLDSTPHVFPRLGIDLKYFVNGYFRQDLVDLMRMAEWERDNGATRIRLFEFD